MAGERLEDLTPTEAAEVAHDLAQAHRELTVAAAVAAEGVRRAAALAGDGARRSAVRAQAAGSSPARWGWRQAVRFAVERRMYTPEYLRLYARYLARRLRQPHVELQGMVFLGPRVELSARHHHAQLSVAPWCWIGADTKLRAHEGRLRLGPKVVMGSANVVNSYLDVEIGRNAMLGDRIYVCDFDHRYERADVPIRKQGISKTPVRIGEDVWVGEKATILRGADIGAGSVIGSQTLVKGVIPPFSVVVGTPGRIIASRLPEGMTAQEALALQRHGESLPGDPLEG